MGDDDDRMMRTAYDDDYDKDNDDHGDDDNYDVSNDFKDGCEYMMMA